MFEGIWFLTIVFSLLGAVTLLLISIWPETKAKERKFTAYVVLSIILFSAAGYYLINNRPSDVRKLKSYNPSGICPGLTPECGICPGYIENGQCYVLKDTFKEFE